MVISTDARSHLGKFNNNSWLKYSIIVDIQRGEWCWINHCRYPIQKWCLLWWFEWEPPHRLLCFNSWSPVGESVGKGLEDAALLEEVCVTVEWGAGEIPLVEFKSLPTGSVNSLIPICGSECELSVATPVPRLPACCHASLIWWLIPLEL